MNAINLQADDTGELNKKHSRFLKIVMAFSILAMIMLAEVSWSKPNFNLAPSKISGVVPPESHIEVKLENPLNIKPDEITEINMTVTSIGGVPVSNVSLKLSAKHDVALKRIRMRSVEMTFYHDGHYTTIPLSGFLIDEKEYVGVRALCELESQDRCLSFKLTKTLTPLKLITKSPIDLNKVPISNNQFYYL